jgi:hypothetical protein
MDTSTLLRQPTHNHLGREVTSMYLPHGNLLATAPTSVLLLSPRGNAFGTVHTDGSEEAVGLTAMIAVLVVAVCAVGILVVHCRVRRQWRTPDTEYV